MKMVALMAGGLALAIAICVAVIHFEAAATRDTMRQMARDELPRGVREGIEDSIGKAGGETGEGAATKLPDAAQAAGDLLRQIRDTIAAPDEPGNRDPGNADPGTADRPKGKAGGDQPPAAQRKPSDMVNELFDLARDTAQAGDRLGQHTFGLSVAEEREWGEQLHQQLVAEKKVVHDRALVKRIETIAAPLLSARKRRDIDYTFTVIRSEKNDLNAFSILGGYIYLHSALIDFAKNDQELQFVLGHEIGHVDLGHCTQQLTYTVRATQLGTPIAGNLAGILHGLISMSYSQDKEFAADAYGFRAVIAAGQTRQQALAFTRHYAQHLKDEGVEEAAADPADQSVAGTVVRRVGDHFHTHPPMPERLRRLEAIEIASPGQETK